jgi:hypothetical protein
MLNDREIIQKVYDSMWAKPFFFEKAISSQQVYFERCLVRYARWIERADVKRREQEDFEAFLKELKS